MPAALGFNVSGGRQASVGAGSRSLSPREVPVGTVLPGLSVFRKGSPDASLEMHVAANAFGLRGSLGERHSVVGSSTTTLCIIVRRSEGKTRTNARTYRYKENWGVASFRVTWPEWRVAGGSAPARADARFRRRALCRTAATLATEQNVFRFNLL
ncbi:hypothetical protein L227DRAFT_100465 [Lentinus tigrinus ALCF2SS1-6]|uniref:Uncharacterized protein n=1 Tax=Lentinus tigrinus ALCF2SS1-6 TaxID=1328759 RepID=A0A5C2SGA0_9APHY|nr:hypothetical protein L227DRAFT_100465 [Lentinus tigrinus ALCF2SS1-6]